MAQLERSSIEAYAFGLLALLLWIADKVGFRVLAAIVAAWLIMTGLLLDITWSSHWTSSASIADRAALTLLVLALVVFFGSRSLNRVTALPPEATRTTSDRPWVVAEGVVASPFRAETPGIIRLRLRNSGEAPAFRVKASGWFYVRPSGTPVPDKLDRSEIPPGGTTTIGSGGFFDLTVALKPEEKALLEEARSGKAVLYFDGFCEYFDSLQNPHQFAFCVEFDHKIGQWNFCGKHNRQEF
ncbi:MAG TPA: hypothetical protein VLO07_06975 [Thermoanaerobaculia bacterium]|nr:hypothetical protein [Thermoanaerobaculia bacterium]